MNQYLTNNFKNLHIVYNSNKILNLENNSNIEIKKTKFQNIKSLSGFSFLSTDVLNIIKKTHMRGYIIKYTDDFFDIVINYYDKLLNKRLIEKIITRLKCYFIFVKKKKNIENIKITIWPTNKKKILPTKRNDIITEEHINSGCTFVSNKAGVNGMNSEVFIWRSEELLKVLLHETMHASGLDTKLIFGKIGEKYNKKIREMFCVDEFDPFILSNEVYTEIMATIFNCFFVSLENNKNNKNNTAIKLFNKEKIFIQNQVYKILWHYEYNSFDELFHSDNCKPFRQKTNVISYFILKYCFFNNEKELLNFLLKGEFNLKNICEDSNFKIDINKNIENKSIKMTCS
jgi:hypothetical protein